MDLYELLTTSPTCAGLTIIDDRVNPAPGIFAPVGVVWHHTAGPGTALRIMSEGRSDLPPPLGNLLIQRDASVRVISDGRANDTGKGSRIALDEVRADQAPAGDALARGLTDDLNLNPYMYDIEVDNDGVGEEYPLAQLDALVRVTAAILAAKGWSTNRCRHHRQMTRRKIDMSYRGDLWTPTALHVLAAASAAYTEEDDMDQALIDKIEESHRFLQDLNYEIIAAAGNTSPANRLRPWLRSQLQAIAGDVSVVRQLADQAATPADVAQVVDDALGDLVAALEGLPDADTGEPVDAETVRRLLIELLEAAA